MSWLKIHAFGLTNDQKLLIAGNSGGQLLLIDTESFTVLNRSDAHEGTITAITVHPLFPYVAVLSKDRSISIWKVTETGGMVQIHRLGVRDIQTPTGQFFSPFQSTSQAMAFHWKDLKLACRSGTSALLEYQFSETSIERVRTSRMFPGTDMATVRYRIGTDDVLTGSGRGHVALSRDGQVLKEWKFFDETIHWFEPIGNDQYLLASDSRRIIRLDLNGEGSSFIGEPFARDDFEHVTVDETTGRIFASSFDRTVYEIDPVTCNAKGKIWTAPFKLRWIKVLKRDPDLMIVQCRNGGLYKIRISTGEVLSTLKETPEALWSSVQDSNGDMWIAGDGSNISKFQPTSSHNQARRRTFANEERLPLPADPGSYTKRLAIQKSTGLMAAARTDGQLVIGSPGAFKELIRLPAAIRDIDFDPVRPQIYACTEEGGLYKINTETGNILALFKSPSGLPLWALSYNPERDFVATSERMGDLIVLKADTLTPVYKSADHRFCKRMKWRSADELLFGASSKINILRLDDWAVHPFVKEVANSIEDFIWDADRRYVLAINYNREVVLFDYKTGNVISRAPDQVDYSKGLAWVASERIGKGAPLEFVTYGRSGTPNLFHIHDERIVALGEWKGQR